MKSEESFNCVPWCHKCIHMKKACEESGIKHKHDDCLVMPGCMGGAMYGLDGCYCAHRSLASDQGYARKRDLQQLERLTCAYPADALKFLALHRNDALKAFVAGPFVEAK